MEDKTTWASPYGFNLIIEKCLDDFDEEYWTVAHEDGHTWDDETFDTYPPEKDLMEIAGVMATEWKEETLIYDPEYPSGYDIYGAN